jgi:hypothetical protein
MYPNHPPRATGKVQAKKGGGVTDQRVCHTPVQLQRQAGCKHLSQPTASQPQLSPLDWPREEAMACISSHLCMDRILHCVHEDIDATGAVTTPEQTGTTILLWRHWPL